MKVELDYLAHDAFRCDQLTEIAHVAESFVHDSGSVTVVLSGDYVKSLKARSGRDTDEIDSDPMATTAAGTALEHSDGTHTILVRQELWRIAGHDPLKSIAHEALHVATRQRGEFMLRLGEHFPQLSDSERHFLALGGEVVEEYRVERALCSQATWRDRSAFHGSFDKDVRMLAGDAGNAATQFQSGAWDEQRFASAIQSVFRKLTYTAAGTIAGELCTSGSAAPARTEPGWTRLVGPNYDRLKDVLVEVPDASTPTAREQLEHKAVLLIPLLLCWAGWFGWTVHNGTSSYSVDWDV